MVRLLTDSHSLWVAVLHTILHKRMNYGLNWFIVMRLMDGYRGHLTHSYAQHRSKHSIFLCEFEMEPNETKWQKDFFLSGAMLISVWNENGKNWHRTIPPMAYDFVLCDDENSISYIYLHWAYNHNTL